MENSVKSKESGFPDRFDVFLSHFNLNTNRLANELGDSNPVKFRRWLAGEVNPAWDSLTQIAFKYKVSLDWLATGNGSMIRGENQPIVAPGANVDYLQKVEARNDYLEKRVESLTDQVVKLSELNFPASDNHTTAPNYDTYQPEPCRMEVAGLVRYNDKPKVSPINVLNKLGLSFDGLTWSLPMAHANALQPGYVGAES